MRMGSHLESTKTPYILSAALLPRTSPLSRITTGWPRPPLLDMLVDALASMATAMLHLFAGQPRPTSSDRPVSLVKCILTLLAVATLIVAAPSGTEAWISCSQQQPSPTSSGTPAAHVSVPDYTPGLDLHLHQLTFLLGAPPCTACTTPDATTPARYPNPVTTIVSTSTQTCTFNDHGSFKTASHKKTGLNGSRRSPSPEWSAPGERLSSAPSFAGPVRALSSQNVRRALPHNLLGPDDWDQGDGY